jgi:2-oxoisovalerate dehydrogenase E1 component
MRELSYIEATREGLAEEMARDPSIFVFGEGIGPRGGNFSSTVGLFELYGPERLRDTPISERGFTTMGIGAAIAGARPVIDMMFVDFTLDAISDIINQASKMRWMSSGRISVPLIVRACMGIFSSGAAHHSGSYYSFFAHIPGLNVVLPATPADAKGLLKTALRSKDPVIFLEHRALLSLKGPVPEGEHLVPFGVASVVREGRDMTMVAISAMVPRCLEAAKILEDEGLSVEIVDPRTVAPLDMDTIRLSVAKTGRLLIVEEDYAPCSIASEIAAQTCDESFNDLDAPIRRLNAGFAPAPYSPSLEKALVISVDKIVKAARELRVE